MLLIFIPSNMFSSLTFSFVNASNEDNIERSSKLKCSRSVKKCLQSF